MEPKRYGTNEFMIDYCNKSKTSIEGTKFEEGNKSAQGKRTDLNDLKNEIMSGKPLDDVILENPMAYHQYGRTMEKLETIRYKKNKRTTPTKGIWIYGGTGTSKSFNARQLAGDDRYPWVLGSQFQCGYKQQGTVVLEDFRGEVRFGELLRMVDRWDYDVQRKGLEAIPFNSHTVIVTSSMHPEELFKNCLSENDKLEQLLRRFEIRHNVTKWSENNTENSDTL